jgi:hypothetical protein
MIMTGLIDSENVVINEPTAGRPENIISPQESIPGFQPEPYMSNVTGPHTDSRKEKSQCRLIKIN